MGSANEAARYARARAWTKSVDRFRRAAYSLIVAYAALLATQHGEFFPCSMFPMFSKAGRPWERAIVRELTSGTDPECVVETERLPGSAVALASVGIDQNDASKALLGISAMPDERAAQQTLARLFAPAHTTQSLAVYRARGALDTERAVRVTYHLFATIDQRGARFARACGP